MSMMVPSLCATVTYPGGAIQSLKSDAGEVDDPGEEGSIRMMRMRVMGGDGG